MHPSSDELHDIAYGLTPAPEHVRECAACRSALAAIARERAVLSEILKEPASPPRRVAWAAWAAAAVLLLGLVWVLAVPPVATPERDAAQDPPEKKEEKKDTLADLVKEYVGGNEDLKEKILGAGAYAMHELLKHRDSVRAVRLMREIRLATATDEDRKFGEGLKDEMITIKVNQIVTKSALILMMQPRELPYSIDPADDGTIGDVRVTLDMQNATLYEVLEVICAATQSDYAFRYGVVLIAPAERLWSKEPVKVLPPELSRKNKDRAHEFLRQLGADSAEERDKALTGLRKLGPAVIPILEEGVLEEDKQISNHCRDLIKELRPKPKAGGVFGRPAAERQTLAGDDLKVMKGLDKTITFKVKDLQFKNVLLLLLSQFGSATLEAELPDRVSSLAFSNHAGREILTLLTQAFGLDFYIEDGKIVVDTKEEIRKLVKLWD